MDRWLAERLQSTGGSAGVRVERWDGTVLPASPRQPVGDMVVGDGHALLGLIVNPGIWFGDAYLRIGARS